MNLKAVGGLFCMVQNLVFRLFIFKDRWASLEPATVGFQYLLMSNRASSLGQGQQGCCLLCLS